MAALAETEYRYELWPKQGEAFRLLGLLPDAPADPVQELLYGGEPGGGKSAMLRALAHFLCVEYWPGCKVALFRRSYQELHDNHLLKLRDELPELVTGGAKYNATDHEITFANGSVLQLRYCEHEDDVYRYQGAEWDALLVDEATQLTAGQYTYLRSRVRSTRPGWRRLIVACANPGGPGHEYFKQHFVDPGLVARGPFPADDCGDERPWPRAFLRATLRDNPSLSEHDYRAAIAAIADPVLRKAYLTGDWNIRGDQAFPEWDPRLHVCEPFTVPNEWTRWSGLDYGYSDPMCWLRMARVPARAEIPVRNPAIRVSDMPRVLVYGELYERRLHPQQQALRIQQARLEEPRGPIWADPSMFARAPGLDFAAQYQAVGVGLSRANNSRPLGIARMHQALEPHDLWPPELVIMETCPNLIRTLPNLPRDKNNPEDIDTHADDHAYDAARYGILGGTKRRLPQNQTYRMAVARKA